MISEKIFVIPLGEKKAIFKFNPFYQLSELLAEYKIPHTMCNLDDEIFKSKKYKTVKCHYQQITKYKVKCNNEKSKRKEYIFFFTADIIDKVLNIKHTKKVGLRDFIYKAKDQMHYWIMIITVRLYCKWSFVVIWK